MTMESSEERCLVCDVSELPLHNVRNLFHDSILVPELGKSSSAIRQKFTTNVTLNQQISVVFLLRKVLRLDKDFLETTLQSTGISPSFWNLKLCSVCKRIVEEANFVFTRLKKLHEEFEDLSRTACVRLFHSVKDTSDTNGENVDEHKTTTARPKSKRGRRGKSKKVSFSKHTDLDLSSITVSTKIRNELILHVKEVISRKYNWEEFSKGLEDIVASLASQSSLISTTFHAKSENRTISDIRPHCRRIKLEDKFNKVPVPPPPPEIHNESDVEKQLPLNQESCEMDEDMPEDQMDDNGPDMDYTPDLDSNYDDENNSESDANQEDSGSDFEESFFGKRSKRRTRRTTAASARRMKKKTDDPGVILKAVKMENLHTYSCPKCDEIFENASLCDKHILKMHYGGKWPNMQSCHLCKGKSFKGEYWLRFHYKMRHHGIKCPVDEKIERSIAEGRMPLLEYEVIPVGETIQFPEDFDETKSNTDSTQDVSLFNRTVNEPIPNTFSVPVVQAGGQIRYLVLPNVIASLPKHVFSLIQSGPEDKHCDRCDQKFPTEMQLKAHFKRLHEGEPMPYECPLCPKRFERIGKALLHLQKAHLFSQYSCEQCGNYFREEILLNAHIQRIHFGIGYPYKCIKCGIRYPLRSTLNKHLKTVHKLQIASYHLLVKPKKSASHVQSKGVRRKKKSKKDKKFPCEVCAEKGQLEVKFVTEEELDIHIKRRHMGIARPYRCQICYKKYSTPAKVERHMSIHVVRSDLHVDDNAPQRNEELSFVCTSCDKAFRTRSLYNIHLKSRIHQNVRPYVCELCSQGFTGLKYLQNHQAQKHHQELNIDPFKCRFCDKVLSSARTLNNHVQLHHTKNASYSCPHCDVQFTHKSSMDVHINVVHTKSQKFLCPQCPKTFLSDFYLKNHTMRVHSGTKPYECQYCSKKFSDKSTFNRHVEAHSDVVHDCPHCSKSGFKTRHALRVHLRTAHKKLTDEADRNRKLASFVRLEPNDNSTPDEALAASSNEMTIEENKSDPLGNYVRNNEKLNEVSQDITNNPDTSTLNFSF